MSKHNNVNPNFYKDGGREHTEGPDKGHTPRRDELPYAETHKAVAPPSKQSAKKK